MKISNVKEGSRDFDIRFSEFIYKLPRPKDLDKDYFHLEDFGYNGQFENKKILIYDARRHHPTSTEWRALIVEDGSEEKESVIIDETKRIKLILKDIYTDNSKLLTLSCWDFEEITAELLISNGYKVELTSKRKDNGYDILAIMNSILGPLKFLVECKRYANRKVGIETVRGFKDVINTEKAHKGVIVTTSYFTAGAFKKQQETPHLLEYRNKDKVIEWVNDYFNLPQIRI